jgi:hypothetical protein
MPTDLERRRQAISAALREIMAEPLPQTGGDRTQAETVERTIDLDAADGVDRAGVLEDNDETQWADEAEEQAPDADDIESLKGFSESAAAIVPPLQLAGSMSRIASMVLFGHA